MHLSVIIPALNEEKYLPKLLQSLKGIDDLEIIVVDGQSEDKTREVAFDVRVITSDRRNVSYQRNLGAKHARHDILLFLDADVIVPTPEMLGHWLAEFEEGEYAAATCRFRPLSDRKIAHVYFGLLYAFHFVMAQYRPWGLGACIMIRRDVFEELQGFDETITINEDAHLLGRTRELGRFRLFPQSLHISARRFEKDGYLRMGLRYLHIAWRQFLTGEIRDHRILYPFGHYDK